MTISGWQSWSPVNPNFFAKLAPHYFSPFGQDHWQISAPTPVSTQSPIAGWCSYYAFARNINAHRILQNAHHLSQLPTHLPKYVIVDDGWCEWGDWNHPYPHRFPQGLKQLAHQIKTLGLKSGLWLAPFFTSKPTQHRARVWPFQYIVDMEDSRAYQSILDQISVVIENWGYEFIKLDFLYSQHLHPRYTSSTTPDDLLTRFLKHLRLTYPTTHINLCGVPLGLAVGNCNSVRIAPDIINPQLDSLWPLNRFIHTWRLSMLKSNLESRQSTSELWLLDPDVFVCRPQTGFSSAQINQLHTLIKQANGVYFLGDDLATLDPQRYHHYIHSLFPA